MAQSKMQEVKSTMWKEVESSSGNFWNPERVGDVLEGLLCKVNADGKYGKVWTVLNMENQEISTPALFSGPLENAIFDHFKMKMGTC